jgi:guanylate kinase
VQSAGKICILDIDIQGVQKVKVSSMKCKYIFIAPPSMDELESRLRGRGTETEDKIQVRLGNARQEMEFGQAPGNFDAIVTNNDLEVALAEILGLLRQWYPDITFQE